MAMQVTNYIVPTILPFLEKSEEFTSDVMAKTILDAMELNLPEAFVLLMAHRMNYLGCGIPDPNALKFFAGMMIMDIVIQRPGRWMAISVPGSRAKRYVPLCSTYY